MPELPPMGKESGHQIYEDPNINHQREDKHHHMEVLYDRAIYLSGQHGAPEKIDGIHAHKIYFKNFRLCFGKQQYNSKKL